MKHTNNEPLFKLTEFSVPMHSGFIDDEGKRVNYGNWTPTYYAYVKGDVRKIGLYDSYTVWLVVGYKASVNIANRNLTLEPVPSGVNIQDMVGLDRVCIARKSHKCYRVMTEDENSDEGYL